MLKGHVFSKQIFENPIFALFINTFLNGENGVSNNYKNAMKPTYSSSTINVDSGAVCIQGRFLEEDTSFQIVAGTNNAYCKLVIEIDLDKQNTESEFNQASYKIITSTSSYPALTQTNIVKNNSGIYQYELARFKTTQSGITDFKDMRTYLDFDSIFDEIRANYNTVLQELEQSLADVKDGSDYLLKSAGGTVEGEIKAVGGLSGELIPTMLISENLNDIKTAGFYYAYGGNTVSNKPAEVNHFSLLVIKTGSETYSQILVDDKGNIYSRSSSGSSWLDWLEYFNNKSIVVVEGKINLQPNSYENITKDPLEATMTSKDIEFPTGFNKDNCVILSVTFKRETSDDRGFACGWNSYADPSDFIRGSLPYSLSLGSSAVGSTKMTLRLGNYTTSEQPFYYKIVLMKV